MYVLLLAHSVFGTKDVFLLNLGLCSSNNPHLGINVLKNFVAFNTPLCVRVSPYKKDKGNKKQVEIHN